MAKKPNFASETIWTADNLPVLRGMNSACVDLIYLDPPFNSKANYAAPKGSKAAGAGFKDTWGLSDINLAWHGEIKHEYPGLYDLLNAARAVHGGSMMSYLIYMAIRVMEMKRVLKDTGSVYVHCDPAAGHYLKLMMDSVFGQNNFRNDIVWRRASGRAKGSQHASKSLGRDCDYILHYSKGREFTHNAVTQPLNEADLVKQFPLIDERGRRYSTGVPLFCQPSMGARPNLCYTYKGVTNPHPSGWRVSLERLKEMDAAGEIIWRGGKRPLRKSFAHNYKGKPVGCLWTDIPIASGKERTGYPTQKPLALLQRIIRASSNKNDIVLDPFCGCATACIAAQTEGRKWAGIDISSKAADLVKDRMKNELGLFHKGAHRTDIPERTDLSKVRKYNHRDNVKHLYGEQGGFCNGCQNHFLEQNLTVDHIIPRSKGGTDHISNLQLLCANCNSIKGDRSHEYMLACLTDKGFIKRRKGA